VLPGAWDIVRGRAIRGTTLLFGFMLLLAVAAGALGPARAIPTPGPFSAFGWINVFYSFPLPPEYRAVEYANDEWEYSRHELMRSHPHAGVLLVFIVLLALVVASTHLARLPAIWRATARPRPLPKRAAAPPLPV